MKTRLLPFLLAPFLSLHAIAQTPPLTAAAGAPSITWKLATGEELPSHLTVVDSSGESWLNTQPKEGFVSAEGRAVTSSGVMGWENRAETIRVERKAEAKEGKLAVTEKWEGPETAGFVILTLPIDAKDLTAATLKFSEPEGDAEPVALGELILQNENQTHPGAKAKGCELKGWKGRSLKIGFSEPMKFSLLAAKGEGDEKVTRIDLRVQSTADTIASGTRVWTAEVVAP